MTRFSICSVGLFLSMFACTDTYVVPDAGDPDAAAHASYGDCSYGGEYYGDPSYGGCPQGDAEDDDEVFPPEGVAECKWDGSETVWWDSTWFGPPAGVDTWNIDVVLTDVASGCGCEYGVGANVDTLGGDFDYTLRVNGVVINASTREFGSPSISGVLETCPSAIQVDLDTPMGTLFSADYWCVPECDPNGSYLDHFNRRDFYP